MARHTSTRSAVALLMGVAGSAGGNNDAAILIAGPYTVGRPIRLRTSNNADAGTRVLTLGGSSTRPDGWSLWVAGGAKVDLAGGVNETVTNLYLNAELAYVGSWGSSLSSADFRDNTYFSGTGILTVLDGPAGLKGVLLIVR